MNQHTHDVIVVGAGFSGLAAAVRLKEAGLDVMVVEARDRVGGKVEALGNGLGEKIDTGGQFFCEDMPEVHRLAQRSGKTIVPTYMDGAFITQPPVSDEAAGRLYGQSMAIRRRLKTISPDDPDAGLNVAAWLAKQPDAPDAKAAFTSMIQGLWCFPLQDVLVWNLADTDRRITNEESELQYFLAETMQSLAEDLADDLADRVTLGGPATAIEYNGKGIRATTAAGVLQARSILIAMPASQAAKIAYQPPLPSPLDHALRAWRSGAVIKALVRYPRPFWRETGLSGMVMWRDAPGLFCCDASPDEEHAALVVFIGGPLARQWMNSRSEKSIEGRIVEHLTKALGTKAGSPLDILWRDWTEDRWSGGGYGELIIDPSERDAEALILAGAPPVYFTFSELSPSFPGYIEGAIIAGRTAADKIVADLMR